MSEPKFTPGPWKVKIHIIEDMTFCVVVDESLKSICEVFSHEPNWEDEQEANANLIAAAPEMYDALMEAAKAYCPNIKYAENPLEACDNCGVENCLATNWLELLRKVRGESDDSDSDAAQIEMRIYPDK